MVWWLLQFFHHMLSVPMCVYVSSLRFYPFQAILSLFGAYQNHLNGIVGTALENSTYTHNYPSLESAFPCNIHSTAQHINLSTIEQWCSLCRVWGAKRYCWKSGCCDWMNSSRNEADLAAYLLALCVHLSGLAKTTQSKNQVDKW